MLDTWSRRHGLPRRRFQVRFSGSGYRMGEQVGQIRGGRTIDDRDRPAAPPEAGAIDKVALCAESTTVRYFDSEDATPFQSVAAKAVFRPRYHPLSGYCW